MSDKPELKPCPFCSGINFVITYLCTADGPTQGLWRTGCGSCGFHNFKNTKEEAIKAWNQRADLAKPSEWISGLKDHEIQELVNAIRDNLLCLDDLVNMGPLREMISGATTKYLEGKNLRIDRPSPPDKE